MNSCIFCNIIAGDIPSKEIYRTEDVISFYDISPKAPVHALVVPIRHISSLQEINKSDEILMGRMLITIQEVSKKIGIAKHGYKVVINNGKASGQMVFHLHAHILGGWKKDIAWEV